MKDICLRHNQTTLIAKRVYNELKIDIMSNAKINLGYPIKIMCPCGKVLEQQNTNDVPLVVCNDYEGDLHTYIPGVVEYSSEVCNHSIFLKIKES